MSPRDLRLCRIIGSLSLATVVATFAVLGGLAIASAKRGDLFPQMHWSAAR